jgi:hypothetical protein
MLVPASTYRERGHRADGGAPVRRIVLARGPWNARVPLSSEIRSSCGDIAFAMGKMMTGRDII